MVWTVVLLVALAGPAAAQSTSFGIGAFAGVSLPMGDYGDTEGSDPGAANLGFSGGLDLFYPLMSGLSWLTTASVTAHSVDEDVSGTDGGYLFIPLMTGLRYDVAAGPVGLFLTGQAGALFNKGPDFDTTLFSAEGEWGTHLGFAVGGGVQATQNVYAGVKYFPLGEVDFEYGEGANAPQSVSFLEIFVGFGVR